MTGSLISEVALKHWIEHFYGYGSWEAPIWFINHEEPSGDMPEEVGDKLSFFHNIHANVNDQTLCDVRELYKQVRFTPERARAEVFTNLHDYRFGSKAVQRGEWKGIISFVHGYLNQPISSSETFLDYQRQSLATGRNNEALIRLYPLPAHSHAWYYSWLDLQGMKFLKSRATYQEYVYKTRINAILDCLSKYKPKVVILHDMAGINSIKMSIQDYFPTLKFKSVKSVPGQLPQHHIAKVTESNTTIIITSQSTGLRHNRIETGFDWEGFGKKLRGN